MTSKAHPHSKMTLFALQTLGKMIKASRIQKNMSQEELAARLNVSRLTVSAIEKGGPKVAIGTFFEAAAIVGIPLLAEDSQRLRDDSKIISNFSSILPKRSGRKRKDLDDAF